VRPGVHRPAHRGRGLPGRVPARDRPRRHAPRHPRRLTSPDREFGAPTGRDVDRLTRSRDAVAVDVPETRFAQGGEDRVSYPVFGDGPPDVVYMQGVTETIDLRWEWPPYAHFLRRLASFSRVVTFDQRGQGASDRVSRSGVSVWEDWAEDARAVLDA